MNATVDLDAEASFVLGFTCPFCEARPGEACTDPESRAGTRPPPRRPHIARVKRAGREAIRMAVAAKVEHRPGRCTCGEEWSAHKVERSNGRVSMACPTRRTK